jgi:Carboxypeptidase regulatory-like domain
MRGFALVGLGVAAWVGTARAQAVTTSAIYGTVADDSGSIEQATVSITNITNGERWQTATQSGGRYVLEYLSPGGSYTAEVRAIGFEPAHISGIVLSVGERELIDFNLVRQVVTLPELTSSAPDRLVGFGGGGPAQIITDTLSSQLPVRGRDFFKLIYLSPQAVPSPNGGVSIAGQPDRLNGLQIDGATNNDLAGYAGGTGVETPGSPTGIRTLSVEAVRELQVVTAPFDVRFGTFAGGLVNAVTRSGSNRWEGSLSGYFEGQGLTGTDELGNRAEDFTTKELALTLGGPIVRDRAAFFLDLGIQRDVIPQIAPTIGTDTTAGRDSAGVGIRYASALRFQQTLRDEYGVEAGTIDATPNRVPSGNLFAKITLQPAINNRIEISHNYGHGNNFFGANHQPYGRYELSSNSFRLRAITNATRLTWTYATGRRVANELTLARLGIREAQPAVSGFPEVDVAADEGHLVAGQRGGATNSFSDQDIWELTDNLSWAAGTHQLTFGTHGELVHVHRNDIDLPLGHWEFDNLDSLESGQASLYLRTLPGPLRPEGNLADYDVDQIAVYAQDRWTPSSRLTVTTGLRVDVPFVPTPPAQNPALLAGLGINTALTPSGHPLWGPRIGFSYDLNGRGTALLRGGLGLFAGRPAYHWFNSVYQFTGLEQLHLECAGSDVPAFTLDPERQPTSCATASSASVFVNYFNPQFRFPRNLRTAVGADVQLPGGTVGTLDLLYIRGVDDFYVTDVNLTRVGVAAGEGGRVLYGTFDPATGQATPTRRNGAFERVLEVRNARGDHSFVVTAQLRKRFGDGPEVSFAYTYTDAKDRLSPVSDLAVYNIAANPVDGSIEDRRVATSFYSVPHKITAVAALDLPLQFRFALFYMGYSGPPYAFTVVGDADAGRYASNDIIYVPRDSTDIALDDPSQYAELDHLIHSSTCLAKQRGRIMRRNSCRDHWVTVVNTRLSKLLLAAHGHMVELTADLFNALNLLDHDWGVRRFVPQALAGGVELLELVGYDQARGRGIYKVLPVDRNVTDTEATRWRLQLGAKYSF